ncbi:hypothetical protein [Aquimarina litoralis]|uniref:hypothetical protein n=1 Tax=Aquimarina litoralis TaxID=584605 RepID=UPI001C585D98|nr:hypothetical protein [Aquimarina litoralis]MBW1296328.1 hypothetical protein [Aquimarina litoralis]
MESELKKYLLEQCGDWMLEEEKVILRRLSLTEYGEITTRKSALIEHNIELFYRFQDDNINEMVSLGKTQAEENIAKRILKDNPSIINNCSKCGQLARTPRARQCRHCGNKWFE